MYICLLSFVLYTIDTVDKKEEEEKKTGDWKKFF